MCDLDGDFQANQEQLYEGAVRVETNLPKIETHSWQGELLHHLATKCSFSILEAIHIQCHECKIFALIKCFLTFDQSQSFLLH